MEKYGKLGVKGRAGVASPIPGISWAWLLWVWLWGPGRTKSHGACPGETQIIGTGPLTDPTPAPGRVIGPAEAAQRAAAQRGGQGGLPGGGPAGVSHQVHQERACGVEWGVGRGEGESVLAWGTGEVSRAGPDSEGPGMLWKEFVYYTKPSGLSLPFDLGSGGSGSIRASLAGAALRPSGVGGACLGPGGAQAQHPRPAPQGHRRLCSARRRRLAAGLCCCGHGAGRRPRAPGPPWPSR